MVKMVVFKFFLVEDEVDFLDVFNCVMVEVCNWKMIMSFFVIGMLLGELIFVVGGMFGIGLVIVKVCFL